MLSLSSRDAFAERLFQAASILTEPVCKSHEAYRRLYTVDALNPTASKIANLARKQLICMQLVGWALLAPIPAALGALCRSAASRLRTTPWSVTHGEGVVQTDLPRSRVFSILSWNICCVGGGYAISDGGVMPWPSRIEAIAEKILNANADLHCIYETLDYDSAVLLRKRLTERGYTCYFNMGSGAIRLSSGIFVASRYRITNLDCTFFPKESLIGRTKNTAKAVVSFDVESAGKPFARIFTTHMQHSEQPEFPEKNEKLARKQQMEIIIEKIKQVRDRCVVLVGDLNLDDEEYRELALDQLFQKGDLFGAGEKTWGGDAFCATMVKKPISKALNLDHAMLLKKTARWIRTRLLTTGYDALVFQRGALSDHAGLLVEVAV